MQKNVFVASLTAFLVLLSGCTQDTPNPNTTDGNTQNKPSGLSNTARSQPDPDDNEEKVSVPYSCGDIPPEKCGGGVTKGVCIKDGDKCVELTKKTCSDFDSDSTCKEQGGCMWDGSTCKSVDPTGVCASEPEKHPNKCAQNPETGGWYNVIRCRFKVGLCNPAGPCVDTYSNHCKNVDVSNGIECKLDSEVCKAFKGNKTLADIKIQDTLAHTTSTHKICKGNIAGVARDGGIETVQANLADRPCHEVYLARVAAGDAAGTGKEKALLCKSLEVVGATAHDAGGENEIRTDSDNGPSFIMLDGVDHDHDDGQLAPDDVNTANRCYPVALVEQKCQVNTATLSTSTLCDKDTKEDCDNVKLGGTSVCESY